MEGGGKWEGWHAGSGFQQRTRRENVALTIDAGEAVLEDSEKKRCAPKLEPDGYRRTHLLASESSVLTALTQVEKIRAEELK